MAEIGAIGVGYLVGLLALVVAVALALRGTERCGRRPGGRLGLAAGTLALLAATARRSATRLAGLKLYSSEDGIRPSTVVVCSWPSPPSCCSPPRFVPDRARANRRHDGSRGGAGRAAPARRRRSKDAELDEAARRPADITVTPTVPFARREAPSA